MAHATPRCAHGTPAAIATRQGAAAARGRPRDAGFRGRPVRLPRSTWCREVRSSRVRAARYPMLAQPAFDELTQRFEIGTRNLCTRVRAMVARVDHEPADIA